MMVFKKFEERYHAFLQSSILQYSQVFMIPKPLEIPGRFWGMQIILVNIHRNNDIHILTLCTKHVPTEEFSFYEILQSFHSLCIHENSVVY
jgi:hypothetical protein